MPDESGKQVLNHAFAGIERHAPDRVTRIIRWLRSRKARPIRLPLGILFIIASMFWFLPIIGIEYLPIGLLLIAQDVPFLRRPVGLFIIRLEKRWLRLRRWLRKRRERRQLPG